MVSQADIDALLTEAEDLAAETDARLKEAKPSQPVAPASDSEPGLSRLTSQLPPNLQRVLKIQVPLIVRLASKPMPLSQITNWTLGSIIEFDRSADEPLDLMINNTCIGYATAVKVGENFGARVTSIIDAKGKLESLMGD